MEVRQNKAFYANTSILFTIVTLFHNSDGSSAAQTGFIRDPIPGDKYPIPIHVRAYA